MQLTQIDVLERNRLAGQYRESGLVVIPRVSLPPSFAPRETDVVFLATPGACEIFISDTITYVGRDQAWHELLQAPSTEGRTRRVGSARGDFFSGLSKAIELLEQAGNEADDPSDAVDRPEEGPEAARRPQRHQRPVGPLRDLVELARRNPQPFFGRTVEMASLKTNLIRHTKPGVLLKGEPGVGKTTVVHMLAAEIAAQRVPSGLVDTPVYDLPLGTLVEGARHVGDIERQLRRLVTVPGRPIFFLDEIHQLGRQELRPVCDILKPALADGVIRVIGATTTTDWRTLQDDAFKRRFLEIRVDEPTPVETFLMLRERCKALADHHGILIDEVTIRRAIIYAARFLPSRRFPDKAIDLLDQAAAMQRTSQENARASCINS